MIKLLCRLATANAVAKGFHEYDPQFGVDGRDARHILSWLALVNTEVAEAAEEVRLGTDQWKFTTELADVCIRVFDIAGKLNLDLESAIIQKMEKNLSRTVKHGGKLA